MRAKIPSTRSMGMQTLMVVFNVEGSVFFLRREFYGVDSFHFKIFFLFLQSYVTVSILITDISDYTFAHYSSTQQRVQTISRAFRNLNYTQYVEQFFFSVKTLSTGGYFSFHLFSW